MRDAQGFPTTGAENTRLGRKLRTAEIADGNAGKAQKRAATEGAGGGEQCTGERVCGTSKHTNNSAPNRSLRQRDVGSQVDSLTRKDAPHSRPARLSNRLAAVVQSIRVSQAPTPAPLLVHFPSMFTHLQPACRQWWRRRRPPPGRLPRTEWAWAARRPGVIRAATRSRD